MRSRPSLNVFGVVEDIGCIIGEVLDFVGGVPSTVLASRVSLGKLIITFCFFPLMTEYLQINNNLLWRFGFLILGLNSFRREGYVYLSGADCSRHD